MSGRGRERLVRCEKCGRTVRKDKAVFIEKMMFANPLDRNQVQDEQYRSAIFREVCYCPSCGKHGRIYEKKKQQNERLREREKAQAARTSKPRSFGNERQYPSSGYTPTTPAQPAAKVQPAQKVESTGNSPQA